MADFRKVTADLSVSPQLTAGDVAEAAAAGFKTVICNRPDGEAPDQPPAAEIKAAAEAHGLAFLELPFSGAPTDDVAARQGALIAAAEGPVLAYCRSGTRSITAWALSQAGAANFADLQRLAEDAGYDLSGLKGRFG